MYGTEQRIIMEGTLMKETMGQIIRRLRRERGFTQEELAEHIGVTFQAVSKWENDTGMPDISQIVPLASVFEVSTDVLFGLADTTENEEAWKIVENAEELKQYRNLDSYLAAYDTLTEGLKKYPNNLILMSNCMWLGTSLSMPDNEGMYASERAEEIIAKTVRQANYIIEHSKNITDVMSARQNLVFLYSANQNFNLATQEARQFPVRTDFTLYSTMAIVNEYMGNFERAAKYLCTDIDYSLQALEDHTARLGKAYYNCGKYLDAIEVYKTFFAIMKAIFKDECPSPYHDFDSGDCYILLAQAYLAVGDKEKAMEEIENSIMYYLNLCDKYPDEKICHKDRITSPLVRETEIRTYFSRNIVEKKLLDKLADEKIQPLSQEERFITLKKLVLARFE